MAATVHHVALMLRLATSAVARRVPTGPAHKYQVGMPDLWYSSHGRNHMRKILARRYGARCMYCRGEAEPEALELDHYLPKWLGRRCAYPGLHLISNLVLACRPCNHVKCGGMPWPLVWTVLASPDALESSRNAVAPVLLLLPPSADRALPAAA